MVVSPESRIRQFESKQKILSILALLLLSGLAVLANTLHMQAVAEQSTKFISRMIQVGDFREVSLTLQEARLDNFKSIHFDSKIPGHSFTLPPTMELAGKGSLWERFSTDQTVVSTENSLSNSEADKITFEFNRFQFVPTAFLIWLLLNLVSIPQTRFMKKQLLRQFKDDLTAKQSLIKSEIAMQVRHNLRTPLAALMRIPSRLPDTVKDDRDLLRNSIAQIKAITSALDEKAGPSSTRIKDDFHKTLSQSFQEISLTIPSNIHFENELSDAVASACVPHIPFEMQALLGNIVNNSIDAHGPRSGYIKATAQDLGPEIEIVIEDDGPGIQPETAKKIFDKGFSSKETGSGLGLFHAKQWIETWGGRIRVQSVPDKSTRIVISIPTKERRAWFLPRLKLSPADQILILDDQLTARHLWTLRLEEAGLLGNAHIMASAEEFFRLKDTLTANPAVKIHCFFDFDLGGEKTGMELLSEIPSASTRCLATGHFDQLHIRQNCEASGFYLLPKSLISDLPIVVC